MTATCAPRPSPRSGSRARTGIAALRPGRRAAGRGPDAPAHGGGGERRRPRRRARRDSPGVGSTLYGPELATGIPRAEEIGASLVGRSRRGHRHRGGGRRPGRGRGGLAPRRGGGGAVAAPGDAHRGRDRRRGGRAEWSGGGSPVRAARPGSARPGRRRRVGEDGAGRPHPAGPGRDAGRGRRQRPRPGAPRAARLETPRARGRGGTAAGGGAGDLRALGGRRCSPTWRWSGSSPRPGGPSFRPPGPGPPTPNGRRGASTGSRRVPRPSWRRRRSIPSPTSSPT